MTNMTHLLLLMAAGGDVILLVTVAVLAVLAVAVATVLVAVAVLAALACLPLWLQAWPQRNGHWIALLLPIHAAFAWTWARMPQR